MTTPEQIAANRANSEKSTGPQTAAGKSVSSQNSFKHGLFGAFRVLPIENQADYDLLLNQLMDEYIPSTPTESILVERMAQHHWLRYRALYSQDHYMQLPGPGATARINLFMRYETLHERAYHKCLNDLLRIRADKQKQENGFVSQTHKQELHVLTVRCREADAAHHETRATASKFDLERKQQHPKEATARENQGARQPKAA